MEQVTTGMRKLFPFPIHGYIGLVFIMVFWYLNWNLEGIRTHWGFFPLWLGYCLTVDALAFARSGTSLITRNKIAYVSLFIISFPFWWLFEALNEVAQYWHYTARESFTNLEYFLLASISFSTVLPAVFGTSELVGTFFNKPERKWLSLGNRRWHQIIFFVLGWIMLGIVLLLPRYGAAFLWISIYFIIDPVNVWLGHRSLLKETGTGIWRSVWTLWLGCLICGFFWELWNYYSNPQWYYTVPGVDFWYLFKMPALGYLGYFPFALELFAMYHFVTGILKIDQWKNYLKVI